MIRQFSYSYLFSPSSPDIELRNGRIHSPTIVDQPPNYHTRNAPIQDEGPSKYSIHQSLQWSVVCGHVSCTHKDRRRGSNCQLDKEQDDRKCDYTPVSAPEIS